MDSANDFNALMSSFDRPMLVVTTRAGDSQAGCLVGFHSQCSIEPPRYAVWLSKANRTFRIAVLADAFALHFLGDGDRELAELFGGVTGDDDDKFAHCRWHPGLDGVPLLDACAARVTARRVALHDDDGDHACLVLAPHETEAPSEFAPLASSQLDDIVAGHPADERPRAPRRPDLPD
jgi:flavin reductase (DIM6/NTAB) family NADH-FMN oxidoreductase RutF